MLNGLLVVNKPKDIISHDVVYRLRRKLNSKDNKKDIKIGHTGTLDPFAEGVLVLCLGDATKLTKKFQDKEKVYVAEVRLGLKTTTDDITGETIAEKDVVDDIFCKLDDVLKKYIGKIEQTPPLYSAISVNGKRLYKYARKNKSVEIPTRTVFVKSIEILEKIIKNKIVRLKIECSSGTYIRALARDIGEDLGVGGTLQNLNRIKAGRFGAADSILYSDIMDNFTMADIEKKLIKLEEIFKELDAIELTEIELEKLMNGNLNFLEDDERFNEQKIDGKQINLMYNQKVKAVVKYAGNKFGIEYLFGKN